MNKQILQNEAKPQKTRRLNAGFSMTEVVATTAMVGILSASALPNYMESMKQSGRKEVQAFVASVPTTISAYIDATGELPTKWDDLSSIAVVMTNNGPATGDLTSPITLPEADYELSISGPTDSIYALTAKPLINGNTDNSEFSIQSCFNVSNGASDLKIRNGTENQEVPNCG